MYVPRHSNKKKVILSASSPDDEALVLGAKYFGFEFINRIDSSAILHTWDVTAPPSSSSSSVAAPGGEGAVGVQGAGSEGVVLAVSEGGEGEAGGAEGVDDADAGEGKPKVKRVAYEVRPSRRRVDFCGWLLLPPPPCGS